jgi:hypothetical protein
MLDGWVVLDLARRNVASQLQMDAEPVRKRRAEMNRWWPLRTRSKLTADAAPPSSTGKTARACAEGRWS